MRLTLTIATSVVLAKRVTERRVTRGEASEELLSGFAHSMFHEIAAVVLSDQRN